MCTGRNGTVKRHRLYPITHCPSLFSFASSPALILAEPSALTSLPWVGHRARRWEPEPLRWSAIRATYSLYRRADRIEQRTQRPSRLGRLVDMASGRV